MPPRFLCPDASVRPLLLRGGVPLALAFLLLAAAACGSGPEEDAPATGNDSVTVAAAEAEEGSGPEYRYEVMVRGMLRDTLSGSAQFGIVFDPVTRRRQWMLSLRSGNDVTSGVYLARPDTARPQAGTYQIVSRPPVARYDSLRPDGKESFTMIYRAGMRRSFHSQSGTFELTAATDSLVEGTFRVTLEGTASPPGQPPREGTLTLTGEFRAEKRNVGFMFGV
jgi:hypothetical protein